MKLCWIRKNTGYVFRFLTQQFFIQDTVCYTATSEQPFSSHFTPLPMYSLDMNTQGHFVTLMGLLLRYISCLLVQHSDWTTPYFNFMKMAH